MSKVLLAFDVEFLDWKFYPNVIALALFDVLAEVCGQSGIHITVSMSEAREASVGEHTCH